MVNLTFGEQVKIILGRKGMTIKELAELVEKHTGKPMSRQNMTQRLGRDNFQEKDMRLIAEILGCKFQLSIMEMDEVAETAISTLQAVEEAVSEENVREVTIGELADITEEAEEPELSVETPDTEPVVDEVIEPVKSMKPETVNEERELLRKGIKGYYHKPSENVVQTYHPEVKKEEEAPVVGEFNPYTGKEYKTNSVRMHPKRIGYVQVYDQEKHKWTEMTQWAFMAYQDRKKKLLGKDYVPPIYLD